MAAHRYVTLTQSRISCHVDIYPHHSGHGEYIPLVFAYCLIILEVAHHRSCIDHGINRYVTKVCRLQG